MRYGKLISAACSLSHFFLFGLGFAASASAATIEKIRKRGFMEICVNPEAMPLSRGPNVPEGFEIDLANAVAKELGVDVSFTWAQFRHEARYTSCDAFMSVGILPGEKGPLKKTIPVLQFETMAVTKSDTVITSIEQLDGRRVAVQSGSMAHATLLDRKADIRVSYTTDEAVLDAVNRGEVDVGVVGNFGLGWYLKRHPDAALLWRIATYLQPTTGYPVAIGLRQSSDETVSAFNQAIEAVTQTGKLSTIKARWGFDLVTTAPPANP